MPTKQVNPIIGEPFTKLPVVDSTNNYAMQQIRQGMGTHGSTWLADTQTGGRGQRDKKWVSESGKNITLSVLLSMEWLPVVRQAELNVAISLAVYDFVSLKTNDGNVRIKWPNDIYWKDKKMGGILIENIIKGSMWQWAVIGIGLNVNQLHFDDSLPNPVSLSQVTKQAFDITLLAQELCTCLQNRYVQLQSDSFSTLSLKYNEVLYNRDHLTS